VHQIGLPYHWGGNGLSTGDPANDLVAVSTDPNVHIQESKVGTCDIVAGRRPRGPSLVAFVAEYRRRAGVDVGTEPMAAARLTSDIAAARLWKEKR
jgi:formate dehydrogenase major subunit